MNRRLMPPGAPLITRDLRAALLVAAARIGSDGKGSRGFAGFLDRLTARQALPDRLKRLQAPGTCVAITVELLDPKDTEFRAPQRSVAS